SRDRQGRPGAPEARHAGVGTGRGRTMAKKPTRREVAMMPVVLGAVASSRAQAQSAGAAPSSGITVENASLADVLNALTKGDANATNLTRAYLARIEAFDRGGPLLNAIRETNPEALAIAGKLDGIKPSTKQPLAG